ncbi:MAG: hypothetical protein ACR2PL_16560 [Dehalococcoidia bacterium]
MLQYILHRLVLALVGLLLATFIVFGLVRLIPGDAAQIVQGQVIQTPS